MGLFSFLGGLLGLGSSPSQRIQVSKASAAAGLPIIYGRRRVTPIKVFKTVSRSNAPQGSYSYDHSYITQTGSDYEETRDNYDFLHRVDVWGQGEITAIEKFWVDGDAATAARFKKRPYFRALSNYGSETQTAMTALSAASSRWTANHKGQGVAYTWSRFYNSSKKPQFTAEPELKAQIMGIRVYDPRQDNDQPNGSGTQQLADQSTWTYSENRALMVLDYLMAPYGFAAAKEDIDFESFMTAADQCDEAMTIPARLTNDTGNPINGWWDREIGEFITIGNGEHYPTFRPRQEGTSQPRWHGAAVLDPKTGVVENLKQLLEGFGWALSWSNGRHRLVLEDTTATAVATFDESSIIGDWTSLRGNREGRLNRITIEFQNENKNFEEDTVSWPEKGSQTHTNFVDADGGQALHTTVQVKTITDFYRAQAYAEYLVRKSRVAYQIRGMRLAPHAMLLEPGDVIDLNYAAKGFSGDAGRFIVEKVQISPTLEVEVDLLKYEAGVYDPDARTDEPLDNSMDIANLWLDPPAVADLTVVAVHESKADGSVITGLDVSWIAPDATVGIDRIEVAWRVHESTDPLDHTGDAEYPNNAYVARDVTSFHIPSLVDDRNYDVRVLYWTQRGQQSDEALQTINVIAANSKLDSIEAGATRNEFRGAYDDATTYSLGDVVTFAGSSYVFSAETPTVGAEPPDAAFWTLLAGAGTPVLVEYSAIDPPTDPQVDTEWHADFDPLGDLYMRQSTGTGTWTSAMRIVGENGVDGPFTDYRFQHGVSQPGGNFDQIDPGSLWLDAPDANDADPVWMISARMAEDGVFAVGASWSTPVKLTGDKGETGNYVEMIFIRAPSQPSAPTLANPIAVNSWQDAPPEADGDPLWMSKATKDAYGNLVVTWSTPQEVGGSGLEVQYSTNASSWHSSFQAGDLYMRQRLSGASSWSAAYRIVGEQGVAGTNGTNGMDGILYVGAPESLFDNNPNQYHVRFYGFLNGVPHKTTPAQVMKPDGSGLFAFGGAGGTSEASQAASTAYMYSNGWNGAWYVILETSGDKPFVHTYSNAQPRHLAFARKVNGVWEYFKRSGAWTSFTVTSTMVVLGTAEREGGYFVGFSAQLMTLEAAPEIGATVGAATANLLPPHTVAGGGSTVARTSNGSSIVLSAADVGSSATITIYAFKLYLGDLVISYNGGTVTGCAFSTRYFVIASDATYAGGNVSFSAIAGATYYNALVAGSIMVGSVTTPADGGSSSSGGGGGVGETCVAVAMYLGDGRRAGDACEGTPVQVMNEARDGVSEEAVWSNHIDLADCVELVSESGCRIICADSTPVTTQDGSSVMAPDMAGQLIAVVDGGQFRWEKCVSADPAGTYFVAHISVGGRSYAAGVEPDRLVVTHNAFKP